MDDRRSSGSSQPACPGRSSSAGLAILLAVILALLGALGRLSQSAVAQGVTSFYTSFFRGTPLIVQMFLIFLALPQLAPPDLPGLRDSLTLTALQAGIIALRPQLWRLHDRDLPRRHPVGGTWPGGGARKPWP